MTRPVYPAPPAPCPTYAWCAFRAPGHTVHQSTPVPLPDDVVAYAETDDTGRTVYGPVLSAGEDEMPLRHARLLAARLRVAAARLEALAVETER